MFFGMGCSHGSDSVIEHPTEENIDMSDQNHSAILQINEGISEENSDFGSIHRYLDLEEMAEITSIGILYGNENEMFGRIEDVVIDSFNRVYILDANRQHIRVFNTNGDYISTLGGRGEGPGEFQMARSMATYKDELLLVSNGYRIEVYDIHNDGVEFIETVQIEKMIHSICISRDQLFLHSIQPLDSDDMIEEGNYIHTIHAYSIPSYEYQFSFGQSYRHEDVTVIGRLTMGNLSCSDASSTVVFTFERMPVIHGYSAIDGELIWKNRIDGLNFYSTTETRVGDGRSSLTYRMPESNIIDYVSPSLSIENTYEIFQVIRANVPEVSIERTNEVHTFLLNSSNGKGTYVSNKIPEIVDVTDDFVISRNLLDDYTSCKIYNLNP